MERTAFVPHRGYYHPLLDRLVDWLDFGREVAAIVYYGALGRL